MLRSTVAQSSLLLLRGLPYGNTLPTIIPGIPIETGANGGVVDTAFENIQCSSSITGRMDGCPKET